MSQIRKTVSPKRQRNVKPPKGFAWSMRFSRIKPQSGSALADFLSTGGCNGCDADGGPVDPGYPPRQ